MLRRYNINEKGSASVEIPVVLIGLLFIAGSASWLFNLANQRERMLWTSQARQMAHFSETKEMLRARQNANRVPCLEDPEFRVDLSVELIYLPEGRRICVR